jgi:hypothetical protein
LCRSAKEGVGRIKARNHYAACEIIYRFRLTIWANPHA